MRFLESGDYLSMAKLWFDILTPKQAKLFGHMSLELMKKGFEVIITARDYEYTLPVLRNIGVNFVVIGKYVEGLREKVLEEARRTIELLQIINDFDILLAFPNPVAARIAFGLGRTYIAFTDSPHSEAPSRLSLPLATAVIFSSCIPKSEIERYVMKDKALLVQFNGVDEIEWLKSFSPDVAYLRKWDLEPFNYVVIRPPEIKASYYKYSDHSVPTFIIKIIELIIKNGYKVLYLPRYNDDNVMKSFKDMKEFIVPKGESVDGTKVAYYAKVVISGGGTMAREAALLGTPAISIFPSELYVNRCVMDWGFPLSHLTDLDEAYNNIKNILKSSVNSIELYKEYVKMLLKNLESPSEALSKVLKMLGVL
jgi:predicted glycosyltransferase